MKKEIKFNAMTRRTGPSSINIIIPKPTADFYEIDVNEIFEITLKRRGK